MADIEIGYEDRFLENGETARVVSVTGEIDTASCRAFDEEVGGFLEGWRLAVLDLSGTTYVKSTGMTLLMKYSKQLREAGGTLVLAGLLPEVETVFREVGILDTFSVAPDTDGALALLVEGPAPAAYDPTADGDFPAHIACVECQARLLADRPGHYRCPRCSIYFEVGADGQASSFPLRSAQSVDLTFPCLPAYVDVARAAVASVVKTLGIPSFTSGAIDRAVDEAIGLYAGKAGEDGRRIRMFVSADTKELIVAFLVTDPALLVTEEDEGGLTIRTLKGIVDELDIQLLSPEGQILKLVKRLEY